MRKSVAAILLIASAGLAQAQTQRNPAGAGSNTLGAPTRNSTGGTSAPSSGPDSQHPTAAGALTRPPLGSTSAPLAGDSGNSPARAASTTPGHVLGVGPNGTGAFGNGTGLGGGAPGATNPAGSNASATPAPLGAVKSNGGSAENGSKSAPMQANGVRKVQ